MEHKYLTFESDKSYERFHLRPNHPLVLGGSPLVGVKLLSLYYTYPNISEKYSNNKVGLYYNGAWHDVTIPKGLYEVKHLNDFIKKQIGSQTGIELEINMPTFQCNVLLQSGFKIDFSKGKLHNLLGLESKIYDQPEEIGPQIININRGIDDILIRCNLVDRPEQEKLLGCIYDVLPNAEPGQNMVHNIQNIEYFPCKDSIVRYVDISFTDMDGNLVEMREKYTIKLVFKYNIIV